MNNKYKKRIFKTTKNSKKLIIFFACLFIIVIFTVLGYSIYRERITNSVSLSVNKPIFTITLDNQNATTAGTTVIYEKYDTGFYLDNTALTQMTTSTNAITKPTRTNYTFGGYYTSTNGSGTQYIDADGRLTASASSNNFSGNGTLYAKWTASTYNVSLTVSHGTPSSQNKTVSPGGNATFTVSPSTNYGGGTVSCTPTRTTSLSGNTLTISSVTSDTSCTLTYQTGPSCNGSYCAYGQSCKTGSTSTCNGWTNNKGPDCPNYNSCMNSCYNTLNNICNVSCRNRYSNDMSALTNCYINCDGDFYTCDSNCYNMTCSTCTGGYSTSYYNYCG